MKPGVFTQIYIHLIFAVKYRDRLLTKAIRPEIFRYMSGIITKRRHKSIIVNGVQDHVHILLGLHQDDKISDLVNGLKRSTASFINNNQLLPGKFQWQDGYGAFSYAKSNLEQVYKYIETQEQHHQRKTFNQEYIGLLKKFEIDFDTKYLFEFFD